MKKKMLVLFACITVVAAFLFTGCGADEYTAEEGTAAAAAVDYFTADGFTVTDVKAEETSNDSGISSAAVKISTDKNKDDIKQYIKKHGFKGGFGVGYFKLLEGENDGQKYAVYTLIINNDKYSMKQFKIKESDSVTSIHYNVTKNGKIFIENSDYDRYLKQKENSSATKDKKSSHKESAEDEYEEEESDSTSDSASHYEICYWMQMRYFHYDEVYGGDSGDKYTEDVFQDAMAHFGISRQEVEDAWFDTDANIEAVADASHAYYGD